MKKRLTVLLMTGLMAAPMAGFADDMGMDGGKAKKVTLTGTLVDVTCYLEEGDTGNDHGGMKNCGTECLNGGSPAGLLVDKDLYVLAFPAPVFAKYVGKKVELTGDVYGANNLIPTKAFEVEKDGTKKTIDIKGKAMM